MVDGGSGDRRIAIRRPDSRNVKLTSIRGAITFLLKARKEWSRPKPAKVVIFDRNGADVFAHYLDFDHVHVLEVRGESINIPVVIETALRHGVRSNFAKYTQRYLRHVKPSVALTHIDNSYTFYLLKRAGAKVKTISVQNGARDETLFDVLEMSKGAFPGGFEADHIFCFGKIVGKRYADHIRARIEPFGSFTNNRVPRAKTRPAPSTVLFISQYRPPHPDWKEPVMPVGERLIPHSAFYAPERLLLPRLADYCHGSGLELLVCGASLDQPDQEQAFFQEILQGRKWKFLSRTNSSTSYERLDQFAYSAFIDSTLGYEGLGRGIKAGVFSMRGSVTGTNDRGYGLLADYPETGPFWTNRADVDEIARVMRFVTSVDDAGWEGVKAQFISDVVAYDPGNTRFVELMRQYNVPLRNQTADV